MYRFRVLGPLAVERDGVQLKLGGVKQRSVLAMLLLHAGETLSTDRLIDGLWGDRPPADAATALHAHVSRLRRAGVPIVTRAPGYLVTPDDLDLRRFEELRASAAGAPPAQAAARLRDALALWSGEPLADLAHEPFAVAATEALRSERLDTLETRIEADLALGADVVAELTRLVAEHPLRERLRELHMLALYRSGRQAEALESYAEGRRRLVDELGLEPGPDLRALQRRVLAQDPELQGPRGPLARLVRRRRTALAGAAAALAAALALVAAFGGEAQEGVPPGAGTITVFDARTGELRSEVAAGRTPQVVSVSGGVAWALDADGQTVTRVAQDGAAAFATGATPVDLVAGAGGVWVAQGRRDSRSQVVGPVATELVRIDPGSRTVRARVALPRGAGELVRPAGDLVAAARDGVWAVGPDGVLSFVAASSGVVVSRVRGLAARAVAVDGPRVWALSADGEVVLLDSARRRVRARLDVEASVLSSLAAGSGAAFASAPGDGVVWRVTIAGDGSLRARPIPVAPGVTDLAFAAGRLWAVSPLRGLLARVHPARGTVELRVPVGGVPRGVAAEGDRVWVVSSGETGAAGRETAGGLSRDHCGPVVGATRQRIVAIDLPLQGGVRLSTQQMAQAIELVARDRGFKAGRHSFGLQLCDDSVATTGISDPARCAANGRAFARQREVVAVIGPLASGCATELLPQAAAGPVAVVAPLTSYVGLTRKAPGTPPGELDRLYPDGRRHFARVFPDDAAALRAIAALVRGRLVIVDDGRPDYGRLLGDGMAAAAGDAVAGRLRWNPQRPRDAQLAARVARLRPDAVFMAGTLDTGGAVALRSVRARIGAGVPVYVTDGFTPTPLLVRGAGPAARDVRLVVTGLLPETLGPDARRFARRVEASLPGVVAEPSALYAAAAAQVVFDALARSDGTRASLLRELFETRLARTPVGSVAFTPAGDVLRPAVTVLRVVPGARGGTFAATQVERVVRP